MKAEYEISLSSSGVYKNESILQILENLEKLENINNEVQVNLNKSLNEKRMKLENLHSRIIRINKILTKLESIPQALTLLSKKFYPENVESFQHSSIYYDNICDFSLSNQVNRFKNQIKPLNDKPANSLEDLGKTPDSNMDDVKLSQEILNSMSNYYNLKSNLSGMNSLNQVEYQPIGREVEMLTSVFNFSTKIKAYGNEVVSNISNLNRESNLLNQFMRQTQKMYGKKQKANIKKPSEAPISLTTNNTKAKINKDREVIKRKVRVNNDDIIDSKLRKNINMPNVVDLGIGMGFDGMNNNFKAFDLDDEEGFDDQFPPIDTANIQADDINDFELPIDKVFQINTKKTDGNIGGGNTGNIQNQNQQSQANMQNQSQNQQQTQQQNNVQSVPQNNQQQQAQGQTVVVTNTSANIPKPPSNIPNVPNIPSIPPLPNKTAPQTTTTVPAVPTAPTVATVAVPKIPLAPQIKPLPNLNQKAIVVSNNTTNIPKAPKINIPVPKIRPPPPLKKETEEEKKPLSPVREPEKDPVSSRFNLNYKIP